MKRSIFVLSVLLLSFIYCNVFSQETETRKIGITASLQNSQYAFSMPIWLSEKIVLAPVVEFKYAEKIGTDFGIGIIPKYYFKTGKVSPYLGLNAGGLFNNPSSNTGGKSSVDIYVGPVFGGEYFIDSHFSVAIELQGNFTKSDKNSIRFGNPGGLNFNTSTAISASIYF